MRKYDETQHFNPDMIFFVFQAGKISHETLEILGCFAMTEIGLISLATTLIVLINARK